MRFTRMPARARGIRDIRTSLSARTVEPGAKPRLWVFVQRPGFSRVSEMLGVDPFAKSGTDLLHEEQELVVLADLRGARTADVAVTVRGDILIIEARPGASERRYYRKVRLPFAAAPSFTQMFNDGVLEIQLRREAREP